MAEKQDIIKRLTNVKGIGQKKAESIYEQGFTSIKKIRESSIEDFTAVDGISKKLAEEIKEQFGEPTEEEKKKEEEEKPEKEEKETEEQKTEEEPKVEDEEVEEVETVEEEYEVKKKPDLPEDVEHLLKIRKNIKKSKPTPRRQESFRYKRLPDSWRRPKGLHSKMRTSRKYRPKRVKIGFRSPKETRGLHPSGFEEVMVHNVDDLEDIDPKRQAARIGHTVGTRKRLKIEEKAEEKDIRVLNKS
ncbi:MAG: 50S ribosomal protein L32e [Candidatus Thermoplasmatota archaeon]